MQEALHRQVEYLTAELSGHDWYGVGRDDGKKAGEYAPVFYRRERLRLIDAGTFWLSEVPDSVGVFRGGLVAAADNSPETRRELTTHPSCE